MRQIRHQPQLAPHLFTPGLCEEQGARGCMKGVHGRAPRS